MTLSGACSETRHDTSEGRQAAQTAAINALEFVPGPFTEWETGLGDRVQPQPLTIDLQERLVDPGKPIIFIGGLADVRRTPNGVVAIFVPSTKAYSGLDIYFRLPLPFDRVRPLRAAPRDISNENLAVVAQISGVRRPDITMIAEAAGDDKYGLFVDVFPVPAGTSVADGELVAFREFAESTSYLSSTQHCASLPTDFKYSGALFNTTASIGAEIVASISQLGCSVVGEITISSTFLAGSGPLEGSVEGNNLTLTVPGVTNDAGRNLISSGSLHEGQLTGEYKVLLTDEKGTWSLSNPTRPWVHINELGYQINPPSGWATLKRVGTSSVSFAKEVGVDEFVEISIYQESVKADLSSAEYSDIKIKEGADQSFDIYVLESTEQVKLGDGLVAFKTKETFKRTPETSKKEGDEYFFVADGVGYAIYA